MGSIGIGYLPQPIKWSKEIYFLHRAKSNKNASRSKNSLFVCGFSLAFAYAATLVCIINPVSLVCYVPMSLDIA